MGYLHKALLLLFAVPLASASQDSTQSLRAPQTVLRGGAAVPNFMALLGVNAGPKCQCTFDDQCTCAGALKFMDCVKKACNSGDCQCMEKDGTNHFLESCSSMADKCSGLGLKCSQQQATCQDTVVAWHPTVKHVKKPHAADGAAPVSHPTKKMKHAVEKAAEGENNLAEAEGLETEKMVPHKTYKSTVRDLHSYYHRVFAQGIVVTLVVLSATVALASSSNPLIAKHTWSIIDFVVVTFLAVAWFIVVIHSLDYFQFTGLWKIALHMAVSVAFLLVSVFISWRLRDNEFRGSIFGGIFTPMVMWCNAGFVQTVQMHFKNSALHVFLFLIVLAVWYGLLAAFFHYLVSKATRKGWGDDVENHMAGGALAAGFVLWCHMVLTGDFHSIAGPRTSATTSSAAVAMLNALSLFFIVLSLSVLPFLGRKSKDLQDAAIGSGAYWKLRLCSVATWFMHLLPRFSFIMSLAHLVLDHMGYSKGSISAQLCYALVSTAIGIFMIALCAYTPFLKSDTDVAVQMSGMLTGLGGFMVGVAWASLLDNSITMMIMGEGYAHPFLVKLAFTAFLTAIVFPVYCVYLKPIIVTKTQ